MGDSIIAIFAGAGVGSGQSRLGKASLVLGPIIPVTIITFPCGFLIAIEMSWVYAVLVFLVMALLSFYVAPLLGMVGSCLAVAALLRKNRRRGVSIV